MNPNISNLYNIAKKTTRRIIGLMSGTSVDGLDVAICNISGSGSHTKIELEKFTTVAYTDDFKDSVASIFSKRKVDLEAVCLLNEWIGVQHGTMINHCLQEWNIASSTVDVIASHGQTIYHAPKSLHLQPKYGNATLQIGDGDHIAVTTGIITLSDFRQKHIAAGGEGAPLAVYGDYLIFGNHTEDRIMLNIGGIANFTYLPATLLLSEVFSTDTGPGNTIMDAYCKQYFNKPYDANSALAVQGTVNEPLLNALKQHPFFEASFPKTTGPELFNLNYLVTAQQVSNTTECTPIDVLRTLNQFTADTICQAIQGNFEATKKITVYSSGGGMHNPLLIQTIQKQLPNATFHTTDALQINPDAKEAVLFALLANEAIAGTNKNFNTGKKEVPAVSMGKICFPN